jgi:hypothetical protein
MFEGRAGIGYGLGYGAARCSLGYDGLSTEIWWEEAGCIEEKGWTRRGWR